MKSKIQENGITEGVIWKQLLLFFFPLLLGTFFQQLYNTVDAVIVGRFVGKEALAAVGGAAAMIVNLFVGFFTGVSTGATVTISQFYGGGAKKQVREAIHTAIAVSAAAGVAIMAAGLFAGVVCVVAGIMRMVTGRFLSGVMTFGIGMLIFATGWLFLALLVLVFGQFFPWLLRSISNVLHRGLKRRKRVSVNE